MRLLFAAAGAAIVVPSLLVQPATAQGATAQIAAAGAATDNSALPANLIRVDGGKVKLGSTGKDLMEQVEALKPKASDRVMAKLIHKLLPELGVRTESVAPYYLNKHLVTNSEYMTFVKASGHRFPFHWWKYGEPKHYRDALSDVRKAFPDSKGDAPLEYWEQKWRKLPFSIPEGQENMPVAFVSYDDALAFAGWAGMRLPTEEEWLLAATPESPTQFLWGDEWDKDVLVKLGLKRSQEQKLKDVGACQFATGRLGHTDIVGQVWEWTLGRGYLTIDGRDAYDKEFKKLSKKMRAELANLEAPKFSGLSRVVKGASYFSWSQPEDWRLQTRGRAAAFQTVEAVGFRVAKSTFPARDTSMSRLRVEYDWSFFGGNREPNIDAQVGMERYQLASDGTTIEDYDAVSIIPVNHMGLSKKVNNLDKLKVIARETPIVLGTLLTTEKLAKPELEPGLYTICYRPSGMPPELTEALKEASRDLLAAAKAKDKPGAKGGKKDDEKGDEKKNDKKKGGDWKTVLSKYGITEEEATVKSAHTVIQHIRIKPGSFKVDTTSAQLLFRANKGDFVAAIPTSQKLTVSRDFEPATMMFQEDNPAALNISLLAGWDEKTKTRNVGTKLTIELAAAPSGTRPWILRSEK